VKIVTLVPYRPADEARERAWHIVYPYYAAWGYPIWTGDTDGDFARAAAINAAAAQGAWDVAIIADADTIQESVPVGEALEMVAANGGAVVPWQTRWKLSRAATERVAHEGTEFVTVRDLDPLDGFAHPSKLSTYPPERTGSTIVVHRAAWDAVGGFDENYTGWGYEDRAFRVGVQYLAEGGLSSIPGTIWHLYHDHPPRDERTHANGTRFNRYRRDLLMRR
jgi:hypothetical protein